jgi:ribosomal RNA-processing protein 9
MSSFFTTPKKRKNSAPDSSRSKRSKAPKEATKKPARKPTVEDDEDISSGSDVEKNVAVSDDEVEDEDEKNETAAERRLRLAQQYLENIQEEIGGQLCL